MQSFLIILAFLLVSVPLTYADEDCETETTPTQVVDNLYPNKCVLRNKNSKEYCACLRNENKLLVTALDVTIKTNEYKQTIRQQYKDRILSVYAQMNYGANFQELTYQMKGRKSKQNGCTPESIAQYFEKNLYEEKKVSKDVEGGAAIERQDNLDNCEKEDCNRIYAKVKEAFSVLKNSDSYKAKIQARKDINKSAESCTPDSMMTFSDTEVRNLKAIQKFFEKHDRLLSSPDLFVSLKEMIDQKSFCKSDRKGDIYDDLIAEYDFKKDFTNEVKSNKNENKSAVVLKIQKDFRENDEKIFKKIEENHNASLPNACVDYDQYKVISSVPSDALLKQWDGKDASFIENALNPANVVKNNSESLQFLRNNPTLAKLVSSSDLRKQLAKSLQSLVATSNNKSKAVKVSNFIDFMKNDVSALVKNNHYMDQTHCENLARNLAAVLTSNDLPELDLQQGAGMDKTSNNLLACKVLENNKAHANIKTEDMLASNELFRILNTDIAPDKLGVDNDQAYHDFLNTECAGFSDFKKKMDASCEGKKICLDNFALSASRKNDKLLKEYYKTKPELGAVIDVVKDKTNSPNMDDVKAVTNESKQDETVRKYYEDVIRPKTKRSIYSTYNPADSSDGSASAYKAVDSAQTEFNAKSETGASGSSVSKTETSGGNQNSFSNPSNSAGTNSVARPAINPGQYIPPFLNNTATNKSDSGKSSTKVSDINDVKEVINDFDELSKDEQAQKIEQSKEFLASQDQNNKEIAELQKKIARYDKELAKSKIEPARPAARSPASTNSTNNSNTSTGSSTSYASPSSTAVMNAGNNVAQNANTAAARAAASYKKALNQKYDEKDTIQGKEKILVDKDSVFEFNSTPISKSELKGLIVVGTPLESTSSDFEKISVDGDALKAYLTKNLKEVPANKIISIKCKGKSCSKDKNEIFLHISRDANNNLVIRSIANDTKIVRVSRIMDLTNTIKSETKY